LIHIRFATVDEVKTIEQLAREIWPGTYGHILPPEQLEYMLKLIYSPASLQNQMQQQHHTFIIVELDNEPVAFASWSEIEKGVCKLHKLYVHQRTQGKGIGKTLIDFIDGHLQAQNIRALRLNVNRHNKARFFYEKLGFAVIGEEDIDIGNNYFMNDYIMEKPVTNRQ
jgi:ribosomal protein S18 acetylase RimI-like enzyme